MYKIPFPLSQKLEINRLIEYWVDFTLYQRLNASFDWIFNGFCRFPISRRILGSYPLSTIERISPGVKSLVKGKIHSVFNQTIDFKLWGKWKRHFLHVFAYLSYIATCEFNIDDLILACIRLDMISISEYVYKMPFPLSQKLEINRLIEYWVKLPFTSDWMHPLIGYSMDLVVS